VEPNGGGNEAEGKARQSRYECRGESRSEKNRDVENAFAPRLKALLGLAYQSQSENLQERSVRRARKIRMRLGGGPILLDPW